MSRNSDSKAKEKPSLARSKAEKQRFITIDQTFKIEGSNIFLLRPDKDARP